MLEGNGRIINRPTKTAGKEYDKFFIYLPTNLVRDSGFPFKIGEMTTIRIDPDKGILIISKSNDLELVVSLGP
jgi:hypothetical protein